MINHFHKNKKFIEDLKTTSVLLLLSMDLFGMDMNSKT